MKDIVTDIMNFETGKLSKEETVELFQKLIDTELIHQLQGFYGRMAQVFLDEGLCKPKK